MPKVTFDTNIFITRAMRKLPDSFYMSIVVQQELAAGAQDYTEIKKLKAAYQSYKKDGRVLVPLAEDWLLVGEVIYSLQTGRKSEKSGLKPKMKAEEKYRITNDVLIARSAHAAGVTVVTDNLKDFEKIKDFCNVRLLSGKEYFGG